MWVCFLVAVTLDYEISGNILHVKIRSQLLYYVTTFRELGYYGNPFGLPKSQPKFFLPKTKRELSMHCVCVRASFLRWKIKKFARAWRKEMMVFYHVAPVCVFISFVRRWRCIGQNAHRNKILGHRAGGFRNYCTKLWCTASIYMWIYLENDKIW